MPRLLSRALLVLGGATAATAAAWLLSSQTAAADSLPSVPATTVQAVSTASTSDTAAAPFETPLSTTVSSVADPVTDAGSTAVNAVTEPSQHAVLPLPAVPDTTSAGLGQLTTGLRGTVGQLDERLPVGRDLPAQLIQHLTRTPVATPAAPSVAVPVPASTTPHRIRVQGMPMFFGYVQSPGVVAPLGALSVTEELVQHGFPKKGAHRTHRASFRRHASDRSRPRHHAHRVRPGAPAQRRRPHQPVPPGAPRLPGR